MVNLDKIVQRSAMPIIAIAAFMIVLFFVDNNVQISKDNNVYVRYIACTLSVPPTDRTSDTISACWDHTIEESNREVHRYDLVEDVNHSWLKKGE